MVTPGECGVQTRKGMREPRWHIDVLYFDLGGEHGCGHFRFTELHTLRLTHIMICMNVIKSNKWRGARSGGAGL